ncbi:MAG TPA: hypothetical protein VNU44_14665 [Bryobacteraceae bacterium]|jgi:hypothetical protein|nr:hypothetical protein [Bryobacteraceae bacterium]
MSWINILRFKRLPRPLLLEEIVAVLDEHRYGGTTFGAEGNRVVCRCGRSFPDGFQQNGEVKNGHRALRVHIAEAIQNLQKTDRPPYQDQPRHIEMLR